MDGVLDCLGTVLVLYHENLRVPPIMPALDSHDFENMELGVFLGFYMLLKCRIFWVFQRKIGNKKLGAGFNFNTQKNITDLFQRTYIP